MGGQFNKFKLQDFTTLNTCYLLHIKCVLCIVQWHTKNPTEMKLVAHIINEETPCTQRIYKQKELFSGVF